METSCAPAVQARFDRALAVLHNFWYARALTQFQEIQKADPDCAMAYWGAAMTYNHPFWDDPSREDEAAAWAYVQKGLKARSQNDREHMYLEAVAALFKMPARGRNSHVTRPIASRWPPRTRSTRTMRPRCFMACRSSAPSEKARRDSRCKAVRSPSSNRSTLTTHSIQECCTTSFTPTTIPFMPKWVWPLRVRTPRPLPRCRTPITCPRTSSRAWGIGTRRRRPMRTRGRFQMTM